MAKAAAAAALLFLLLAVAFANDAAHLPPGDQDASGDDEDMFSGSGFEPSPDEKWVDVSNAEKPTDSNLTSVPTSAATENQHPVVMGTQSAEEMESATVPTTRAVETEIPIMGPKEELDQILVSEKNGTEESTAVFLAPTSLPTVQPYSVKITTLHVIDPVMHHVPQEATTAASTTQATDLVPHAHKDTTSTTEAIETTPTHHHHHHHHGHHHGHHHEVTTHSNPTEATEPHVHHVHHPATSTTSATSPIDPQVHHGHGRHVPHPDAPNATVIAVVPDLTTKDANLLEEDPINEETTTAASYHDDSQTNFPVVIAEGEPETERPDPADVEGSAETTEETDFFLEPVVHEGKAAGTVNAAENEGISDTSTGFMEQKGVLAAVIAGGVAGLLFAICLVGFMLYRMKKKDEGSYCLEETKQTNGGYEKPIKQEEFYA